MLNAIIRFSLNHRALLICLSLVLLFWGSFVIPKLPIDVFPSLDRPRITVLVEAPGMTPQQVVEQILIPAEAALGGATGVQTTYGSAYPGLGMVRVEFDWGTDYITNRTIVNQQLDTVKFPEGTEARAAPPSSVMGQIMIVGMWHKKPAAVGSPQREKELADLRTLAEWNMTQRFKNIAGVSSDVFVMGGNLQQYHVLVDPVKLRRYSIPLHDVDLAINACNISAGGGYLEKQGRREEIAVRIEGRLRPEDAIAQLEAIPLKKRDDQSYVCVRDVAKVQIGAATKRGDARAGVRHPEGKNNSLNIRDAVLMTVNKQPGADTREITEQVEKIVQEFRSNYPDLEITTNLYQQRTFIDRAVENVLTALEHGALLVVIVLFVFLFNFRTTFITLTTIPLSLVTTALIFYFCGLSINTMTLGGIAVAMGELVDDAIVDVENIYRRLRQAQFLKKPLPAIKIVYRASLEIRSSIVFGTMIVVLVFLPLFSLEGMEGRLFTPLAIAYILSILSSLLISLTVTPVLSYLFLKNVGQKRKNGKEDEGNKENAPQKPHDFVVLRVLKIGVGKAIHAAIVLRIPILLGTLGCVILAVVALLEKQRDFLPPFNEGAVQVNVLTEPGTSLAQSQASAKRVERQLETIPALETIVLKTGRAENDEHAIPVNVTEIIASVDPDAKLSREELLEVIREKISKEKIVEIEFGVEQPLSHLISSMLSGVQSQIAVKVFGEDAAAIRQCAEQIKTAIRPIEGVTDLRVEEIKEVPQLLIQCNEQDLSRYGLKSWDVCEMVETAIKGRAVTLVQDGPKKSSYDVVLRLDENARENTEALRNLVIDPNAAVPVRLRDVGTITELLSPNMIKREGGEQRINVTCNVSGRGLVDVFEDIREKVTPLVQNRKGIHVKYGGLFESQQRAAKNITLFFLLALVGMFLLLYTLFRSANLAFQVMAAIPIALVGSVAALYLTDQTLSIAAMVGFISVSGIATRNGILLISHYLHLVQEEGEAFSAAMVVRAGCERVAPVLMTALTSGIGLLPLALAAGETGKEILYPIATVIIGGLCTCTLAEFFVRPALVRTFGIQVRRKKDL